MEAFKFTQLKYIQSAIEYGAFASSIDSLNDPYEWQGIRYPESLKVCCLTSAPFRMLMWSHYAKHAGCRIDFFFDERCDGILRPVTYANEFVDHTALSAKELVEYLYTKGVEWRYEDEIRAVWQKEAAAQKRDDSPWIKSLDGNVFLRGTVQRITFGLPSEKNRDDYLQSLKVIKRANQVRSDDTQIEVCKCRMKNGSYQLTYDGQFDYLEELSRLE